MIGTLKLIPSGIIARSGFKYIRFDPPMSVLPQREVLIYRDEGYEFQDKTIHVSFNDEDIKRESMAALILNNCKVLNCSNQTGKCTTRIGERNVVLTEDFKLAPIVSRHLKGPVSDRHDVQAYSDNDFIKFQVTWDKKGVNRKIESSLKEFDDQMLWKQIEKTYPDINKFLAKSGRSASNLSTQEVSGRQMMNTAHYLRFKKRYGDEFKINYDVDMDKFKSMDVIDLSNIQEIKIDNDQFLSGYSIYEILPNTVVYRGTGLTTDVLDGLSERKDKFYMMLIDNSIEHRIRKHSYATLYINTKILVPETMVNEVDIRPEMVFLKFNRIGLKNWLANNIISRL